MSYPILATKLYKPKPQRYVISRPQLIESLNRSFESKLTLISTPAGYGKTTLVSEWIDQCQASFGWIALDQNDNDFGRFLAYLIASLNTIGIKADRHILTLLQSHQADKIETILIPLINQIATATRRFGLVLDDYHLIQSAEIHQALTYLLDHLPANMHLIIATRADPPLPLARLRARGQMVEFRVSDLRFSLEECDALLNQIQGLNLAGDDIRALLDRTSGWVAALQMISIALKRKKDTSAYIRHFSGTQDYIADFLTSEIIDQQPENIYDFLLKTSILDRLSGSLCDATTNSANSQPLLTYLRNENLFLVSLDDESHWFCYHHLFADLLNQRLLETYPHEVPTLYRKASEWFDANGFPTEAIDYALRGRLTQRAVSLIKTQAESILIRSEIATFISWMRRLPDEVIFAEESLCIYYAWALLISLAEPESAVPYLERVIPTDDHTSGRLAAVKSVLAVFQRQIHRGINLARQALEDLPQDDFFFRQIAAWSLSGSLFISGDRAGGAAVLEEVARVSLASKNLLVAIVALCRLGSYRCQQGHLHASRDHFERAIQIASDDPDHPLPVACEAMLGLGQIYWEWDQLETARAYLLEGIALSKRWRGSAALEGYIILAHINQTLGDVDCANQMILEAQRLAVLSVATDTDDKYVASQEIILRLRQGSIRAAENWAFERGLAKYVNQLEIPPYPKAGADIVLLYELQVYARTLIAKSRSQDALRLLDNILPNLEHLGHRRKILETYILVAMAWQSLGNTAQAISSLGKALALSEDAGYLRVFLDEGPGLAELLEKAVVRGGKTDFAVQLLASFSTSPGSGSLDARKPALFDPLSEREMEVLRWLATELSGPEIARRLYITVSTFRTHVKNIYSKLGVHSRFEAVSKGKALELL